MVSWIRLHKFAGVIFGIAQKLFYITPSNLVRSCITNKEIFVSFFYKFTFLKVFDNPLSKYLIFKRISCMQ